ncbi:hypothetical protein ACWC3Y_11005 [Streptomyces sp. NPDC001296]
MIIHDAATAWLALIHAAVAWVQILAGLAAIVLCALPLCLAPAVKAVRRRATGPSWARGRLDARFLARRRTRAPHARTAPWVHTQPRDYGEAA